jgi:hypothetical protein
VFRRSLGVRFVPSRESSPRLLVGHSEFWGLPRGHIKCGAGLGPSGVMGDGGEDPYSVQTGSGQDLNPQARAVTGTHLIFEWHSELALGCEIIDIRYISTV